MKPFQRHMFIREALFKGYVEVIHEGMPHQDLLPAGFRPLYGFIQQSLICLWIERIQHISCRYYNYEKEKWKVVRVRSLMFQSADLVLLFTLGEKNPEMYFRVDSIFGVTISHIWHDFLRNSPHKYVSNMYDFLTSRVTEAKMGDFKFIANVHEYDFLLGKITLRFTSGSDYFPQSYLWSVSFSPPFRNEDYYLCHRHPRDNQVAEKCIAYSDIFALLGTWQLLLIWENWKPRLGQIYGTA